jgi:Flp pilus assembly protein TadD
MKRSVGLFAAVLLAGTTLSGSAQAGWFSSSRPKDAPRADAAAAQKEMPQVSLDNDIRQAQMQRAAGDFDGATRSLAQMMMVYPDDPRVVGEYGKVLTQQGRSRDAVNFLRRAAELNPGDWTLYSALGVAFDQTGETASARVAYDRALQLKPGEAVVLNNYALSRAAAGDLAGAQRMMAQAAATGSANPTIARNVVVIASLKPATAPVSAVAYNRPVAKPLPANTVMQKVPVDTKAGPVAVAKTAPVAASRVPAAKGAPVAIVKADLPPATQPPRQLAAGASKAKAPAKKSDATPALRMTADASAP